MPRFALIGSDLQALCICEALSEHEARMWGLRHPSKVPGFSGLVESEDAYFERTRGPLAESFAARYLSEGASEDEAQRMAQTACGDRPRLRVVQVAAQDPMPRAGEVTR
jgi:predicted ATP-grasp superfamily ATP-dependent carboligase